MSFLIGDSPDREDLAAFPKVARQHELAAQGLPVPAGVVASVAEARRIFAAEPPADVERELAWAWAREQIAAGSRLIARTASPHEDGEQNSGAGLGLSVAGLTDLRAIAGALTMIEAHARSTGQGDPSGERTLLLLQREVPRRALLVAVRGTEDESFYVEVHGPDAGPEPLAEGRSPDWAGPLADWPDESNELVDALASTVAASESGPHGVDIEIVVDPRGDPWLVQARPLTAPLHPGWPAFRAAVAREHDSAGDDPRLRGRLTLDGEHNPTPLSPAHAWVMQRLRTERPGKAGDPVILAGWLYMRALPRHLGRPGSSAAREPMGARGALTWLRDVALPAARGELDRIVALLAAQPPIDLALQRAEDHFLAMTDDYVERLVPARRQALKRLESRLSAPASSPTPLTLLDREAFLDVLPAVWDVASPSLAELFDDERRPRFEAVTLPEDDLAAARLLGEWDDHLFALGLAPLRRVWLYAAARLGLAPIDRVFLLTGDELRQLDLDPLALGDRRTLDARLDDRARTWNAHAELEPPTRIIDGHPLPSPVGGRLRGLAIGEPFVGPVVQRRDLRDLLADPPPADAVLCIPSLTAQAAVALDRLGVRAVCTEYGGALAHGALMARELGLSALIGCRGCTRLTEGVVVRLDTRARRLLTCPVADDARE